MVMIGPGTGVAPFIGFLQHRKLQVLKAEESRSCVCEGTWRGGYEVELLEEDENFAQPEVRCGLHPSSSPSLSFALLRSPSLSFALLPSFPPPSLLVALLAGSTNAPLVALLPVDPAPILGGWAALTRTITKDELGNGLGPAVTALYGEKKKRRGADPTVVAATLSLLRLDFSRYVVFKWVVLNGLC